MESTNERVDARSVGTHVTYARVVWTAALLLGAAGLGTSVPASFAQHDVPHRSDWTVTARACTFTPARIDVDRGDIVRIEFVAADAPYSFVIDAYRIAKRATPGHSATVSFLASQAGTFDFYSDLRPENGCRETRGTLVVR
jgi:heme/copper-type cytochrome/quinol oxidase subunit 2